MRKIIILLLVLMTFGANAQRIQKINNYGYAYNHFGVDTLFYLPSDTFSVPAFYQSYPFMAKKGSNLYLWNTSTFIWELLSGGGSSYTFPYSVVAPGNAIQLENDTTANPANYFYGRNSAGRRGWYPQSGIVGVNIFNSNGTITGNRVVDAGSNTLRFLLDEDLDQSGFEGIKYGGFIGFQNGNGQIKIGTGSNVGGLNFANGLNQLYSSSATKNTAIQTFPDSIILNTQDGFIKVPFLNSTTDTTGKSLVIRNLTTGLIENIDPALIGGGSDSVTAIVVDRYNPANLIARILNSEMPTTYTAKRVGRFGEFDLIPANDGTGDYELFYTASVTGPVRYMKFHDPSEIQGLIGTAGDKVITASNYVYPGVLKVNGRYYLYVRNYSSGGIYLLEGSTIAELQAATPKLMNELATSTSDFNPTINPNGTYIASGHIAGVAKIWTANSPGGPWVDKGEIFSAQSTQKLQPTYASAQADGYIFPYGDKLFYMINGLPYNHLRKSGTSPKTSHQVIVEIDPKTYKAIGRPVEMLHAYDLPFVKIFASPDTVQAIANPVYVQIQDREELWFMWSKADSGYIAHYDVSQNDSISGIDGVNAIVNVIPGVVTDLANNTLLNEYGTISTTDSTFTVASGVGGLWNFVSTGNLVNFSLSTQFKVSTLPGGGDSSTIFRLYDDLAGTVDERNNQLGLTVNSTGGLILSFIDKDSAIVNFNAGTVSTGVKTDFNLTVTQTSTGFDWTVNGSTTSLTNGMKYTGIYSLMNDSTDVIAPSRQLIGSIYKFSIGLNPTDLGVPITGMEIVRDGNLGTDPNNVATTLLRLSNTGDVTNQTWGIDFNTLSENKNTSNAYIKAYSPYSSNQSGFLAFGTRPLGSGEPTQRMLIKDDGVVLINDKLSVGTASTGYQFHVQGTGNWTNTAKIQTNSVTGTGIQLQNTASGGKTWSIISTGPSNSGGAGLLTFYDGVAGVPLNLTATGAGFGTYAPTTALHVVGSPRFVDGNQGLNKIWTSDANGVGSWQVATTYGDVYKVGTPTANQLAFWTGDGTIKGVDTAGLFGAGGGGGVSQAVITDTLSANVWRIGGNSKAATVDKFIGTTNNTSMRFRTNNTERVVIDSSGRVGINSNPSSSTQFRLKGFSTSSANYGFYVENSSGNSTFAVGDGGAISMGIAANPTSVSLRSHGFSYLGGTGTPVSTVEVAGSFGTAITTTATNLTLDGSHHTVIITGGTPTITLPAASGVSRRSYRVVNQTGSGVTVSSYLDFAGASSTTISANSAIEFQSNGTSWYRVL